MNAESRAIGVLFCDVCGNPHMRTRFTGMNLIDPPSNQQIQLGGSMKGGSRF